MRTDRTLDGRLSKIQAVWSQYIESKRRFLVIAERCCLRGWPDKKGELRHAFRLQELYCELEKLRLEHFIAMRRLDQGLLLESVDSLSALSEIIYTQWTEADETALRRGNDDYKNLSQEMEKHRAAVADPTATAGPYKDAQRDPEYVTARQEAAAAVIAYDKQLALTSS